VEPERLQKVLARAGFGSRRACEELIASGRVTVNGVEAELGSRADPDTDDIRVDGAPVRAGADLVYYALHKPTGVVTTASDPQGRPTVLALVPAEPRVFPVGRLDMDTSGLLLLTNDGGFANRLTHPRYGVTKTYVATVRGSAGPRHVARLTAGVELEDGPAAATDVRVTAAPSGRSVVVLTVAEGRNRLVRRLLDAVGLPVVELVRTSIGGIDLTGLAPGEVRPLDPRDVHALLSAAGGVADVDP